MVTVSSMNMDHNKRYPVLHTTRCFTYYSQVNTAIVSDDDLKQEW